MGKFVKVILYIILIAFAFIWFSTVFKSCGKDKVPNVVSETVETIGETAEDAIGEVSDDLFEEDFESDDAISNETTSEDEIDYAQNESNQDEDEDDYVEESNTYEEEDYTPPPTNNQTSNNSSSYGGSYMVVAGSYLVRSNAESMVTKLANLGYNNSEVVVFQNSQYNSVIAGRYEDYNSAVDVVNQLKRRDIQAYAHRRK